MVAIDQPAINHADTPPRARGSATRGGRLDPLSRLAIARGTDKYGEHFYTPLYHRFLAPLRRRRVTVLEAGIGGYGDAEAGGESLAMWRDYFPRGRIVGFDVAAKRLDLGPRVEIRRGSMADVDFLCQLGAEFGPFDLVVDDGSHVSADTIAFVEAIFPFVADGGFLAIEDTQTSYWPAFRGSLSPQAATTMNFVKALVDELDHAERRLAPGAPPPHRLAAGIRAVHRFHNLVLIEKGSNADASNFAPDRGADPARRAALAAHREAIASGEGTEATALAAVRLARDCEGAAAALADVQSSLEQFPDSWRLELLAAGFALELGRVDEAAAHAGRGVRDGRLDAELLVSGSPKLRSHFPDLAALAEAAGSQSPDAWTCLKAARIFERLKDRSRALDWLRKGVSRPGLGPMELAEFADAFRRAGDPDAALELAARAADASGAPSDMLRHAILLRAAGRFEEALDALGDALALDWRQPRAHLERCHALAALGRDAEAFEAAGSFSRTSRSKGEGAR